MRKFKLMVVRALDVLQVPRNFVIGWLHGIKPDASWRFYGMPHVRIRGRNSFIRIGKRFSAVSKMSKNAVGIIQPVMLKVLDDNARIVIGDDVGISGCSISACESITIGNHVLVGSGAIIVDSDFHPLDPEARRRGGSGRTRPVVIEDDVFIGARAIVLKGVTIGRGSIVGAGAVVARSIPAYSIAVGNPARVVGDSRSK